MKTMVEVCRTEVMNTVGDAIAAAIAAAKRTHGVNDPDLSRYLVAALVVALLEETAKDKDLFNRSVEVLAEHGSD